MKNTPTPALISGDSEILPISKSQWMVEEKSFEISNTKYDIGEYLEKINIRPYQIIHILFKKGTYIWEKPYKTPESCKIYLTGENYVNGGNENKVTIIMTEKHTFTYEHKEYFENYRLFINDDTKVTFEGINIIEKINDEREITPQDLFSGVFNLKSSSFHLLQCKVEISTSPFINFTSNSIGKVFFGHTTFYKDSQCNKKEVSIVGAYSGWMFKGNKGTVSKSYTNLNNGCIFEKNPRIEYIE